MFKETHDACDSCICRDRRMSHCLLISRQTRKQKAQPRTKEVCPSHPTPVTCYSTAVKVLLPPTSAPLAEESVETETPTGETSEQATAFSLFSSRFLALVIFNHLNQIHNNREVWDDTSFLFIFTFPWLTCWALYSIFIGHFYAFWKKSILSFVHF